MKHKHSNAAVNSSMIRRPIRRWFPLFMGPMVCAFIIGFVYPFCKGIYLSFCKFKVTSDAHFVGLENYRRAFQDASFVHSFWFTALFAVISLVLINVLAFAVAYALTQGIKGSNLYRTVFFMPNLIGGHRAKPRMDDCPAAGAGFCRAGQPCKLCVCPLPGHARRAAVCPAEKGGHSGAAF